MDREYFIVKPQKLSELNRRVFHVEKYNSSKALINTNIIVLEDDGSFTSNDRGFITHRNEYASRRIRIVKTYLEQNEPKFCCYWFEGNKITSYEI